MALACITAGCANFIREADAVVPDIVPGSAEAAFEDTRQDGAVVTGKIRFTCQKQLFSVTNIYETPYSGQAELYEVPVGLIALLPAFLWYGLSEAVTLGSIEHSVAAGPVRWAAAGLNPFLNVENGMFAERYHVRRKPGSQRPQDGSRPEPYDAVIPPLSPFQAAFDNGERVDVAQGPQIAVQLNLVELARVMPSPRTQKIELAVRLRWDPQVDPLERSIPVYIDLDLAGRLHAVKPISRAFFDATTAEQREIAFDALAKAGFSREAAMMRDRVPPL